MLMKTLYGENGKIHKAQQGFRPGAGTEINLARLLYLFENIRAEEVDRRKAKVGPKYG